MKMMRLDKYLCDLSVGTRQEVKSMIKKGRISVNGTVAIRPEQKVSPEDEVRVEGNRLVYEEYEYYMFHKPAGCVSATEDHVHETVLDYIETNRKDLFPVGRLDLDTEGLLLITNDGELAHRLLSPKKNIVKTYFARVQGKVTLEDIEAFRQGLDIGDEKPALPAELKIIKCDEFSETTVSVTEGRFHEVKRLFEATGKEVVYLKRLSMGPLRLDDDLKPGEYRKLTEEELRTIKAL